MDAAYNQSSRGVLEDVHSRMNLFCAAHPAVLAFRHVLNRRCSSTVRPGLRFQEQSCCPVLPAAITLPCLNLLGQGATAMDKDN